MATRHPDHDPDGPPPDWRALLAALPDQDDEPPPGTSRRRWRRARRRASRRQRAAAVTAVRARPVHPAALLLVVLLVLVLGVLARCGGGPGGGDDRPPATAAPSATPTVAPAPPPAPSVPADTEPDDVAAAWTRAYLTRDPLVDQTHRASVRRAAAWATEDLTRNLTEHIPAGWGRQVSRGEATRVTDVAVRPAGTDLPPDNAAQVWRITAAEVDVAGDGNSRRTDTLRVELTRTTAGWRVSRVLGV
ncbi:hypothetical protein [Streptomyces sp. NBC_00105]|uniref:hypothetical protein n=1 Tax=Streptomyces sp. NBC_00105 TaxID=2903622 RepID=UPI002F915B7B